MQKQRRTHMKLLGVLLTAAAIIGLGAMVIFVLPALLHVPEVKTVVKEVAAPATNTDLTKRP